MKLRLLVLSLILFTGLSAAQSSNNTSIEDVSPGWVKADSPIYGLDVTLDNILKSPGAAAVERASEFAVAERRNHSEAADKALQHLNRAVAKANNRERGKLERAESILTQVRERVPEEAQFGIETALNNTRMAQNRVPEELTTGGGGVLPDIKLPGGGDQGSDLDVPGGDNSPER